MQPKRIYARPVHVDRIENCYFHHVMEIPGCGLVGSDWDLRGGVDDYLGHVDLSGKRVREIGPATGFLTFEMESRGAEVVAVELGPDSSWDVVPHALIDRRAVNADRQAIMVKVRNGYWFAHERFGSSGAVFYRALLRFTISTHEGNRYMGEGRAERAFSRMRGCEPQFVAEGSGLRARPDTGLEPRPRRKGGCS
ncbi:MAG: hypothetical protein ABSB54_18395 [Acidimicrobiales bacterium]|jgi:hypothetical protein